MKQKAFSPVIILVLIGLIVVAGVAAYLYFNSSKTGQSSSLYTPLPLASTSPSATPAPVSNSEDDKILQMELDQTTTGSVDSDVKSLNSDASSL